MLNLLRSEIRKLYTVRSTYAILLICLLAMGIFAFWIEGFKAGNGSNPATDPYKLASLIRDSVWNLAFFGGLVGLLSLANEYRHNTIIYTLSAANSRSKVLLSKILTASAFSVFFTVFVVVFSGLFLLVGLAVQGVTLSHQTVPVDLIWRLLFISWGYIMLGLLLAALIRQQVGALAVFFVLPSLIEGFAAVLLKNNAVYLPYTSLQQVAGTAGVNANHLLSHSKAAAVFVLYLVGGWIVAWYLFLRRDAT